MEKFKPSYVLETQRLGLRKWLDRDLPAFAAMNGDPDVMKYFPNTQTSQESAASLQRIGLHFEKYGFGLLAVENKRTRQFMGFTGFQVPGFDSFFMPAVEIGWRFKKEYWGQGFASEAARACLQYSPQEWKLDKIVSFTARLNTASEKLMKTIGMIYVTDFDHPLLEKSHPLCPHVLYQVSTVAPNQPARQ